MNTKLCFEQAPENVLTLELTIAEGDKKTFTLVLNYAAIIKAEKVTGINFANAFNWLKLSAENLSVLLWASMLKYHPEISLEDVRALVPPALFNDYFEALIELCHPGWLKQVVEAYQKKDTGENQPSQAA